MKWTALLALSLAAARAHAQAHIRCQTTIGGPCGDSSRPREMNCCDYGYCQPWNTGYYQCLAAPAKCPKQETDIDYAGNDLGKPLYGLAPDKCCDACAATVDCVAYTFVNQNPDGKTACYLKSATSGRVEKKGAVSGVRLQAPANCPTQEIGVDYYGNDLKAIEGLTQGECCDRCATTPECKAYSWVASDADGRVQCYLKRSDAGRKPAPGVISGALPTTAPPLPPVTTAPPPPPSCPNQELNVDYYGNDIKTVSGVTNAQCCDECGKTNGCKAYTFVPVGPDGKSACYLKNAVSGKTNKPGAVSALLQATPPPQPPANCPQEEWNVDYYGNDIKTVYDVSQTACCDECGKTAECVAYTFVAQNPDGKAACYLKKSTAGKTSKLGAVSGSYKTTPPPAPGNCPAQEKDVDYFGNDLKAVYGVTNAQCCDACGATSGCKAYTFVAVNPDGKSACYLKKSSGGAIPKAGAVSAEYKCPTPLMGQCGSSATGSLCCPSGAFCQPWNPGYYQCVPVPDTAKCPTVVDGVDFYGGDLEVQYGLLPGSCCEACYKNKDCHVFTFVNYNDDGRSACYLKSTLGEQRANARAVSGYKIKQ